MLSIQLKASLGQRPAHASATLTCAIVTVNVGAQQANPAVT
jgi:hypothetical protein